MADAQKQRYRIERPISYTPNKKSHREAHPGPGVRSNPESMVSLSAQRLAEKLNKEIEKGNNTGPFLLATFIAAFKDFLDILLDFFLIGEIPGVSFAIGLFCTTFLFFFMFSKGYFLKTRLRIWFWVLGLFFDGLPGFNALPTNTLLVLYAWRLAIKRKHKAEEKLKNLHRLPPEEIEALDNDISLLEA